MINKIKIVRGTTNVFNITINDETGTVYKLTGDEKIIFGVKRDPNDTDFALLKSASFVESDGVYSITLAPEDTANLMSVNYSYDVSLQSGANFFNIIEPSPFVIIPNITAPGVC